MRSYRAIHLLGLLLAAGSAALIVWWVFPHTVEPLLSQPGPVHDFLYHRSPIQWLTILTLCFILALLSHRLIDHFCLLSSLRRLSSGGPLGNGAIPGLIGQRFEQIRRCKAAKGPDAAAAYCAELTGDDEANLERIYGLVSSATQLMLALGFLGTVWGISQSIFGSFSDLGNATTAELKEGLQGFTNALGTALDTTVLAIVCSLIATVLSTLMRWLETNSIDQLETTLRNSLWIDRASHPGDEILRRLEAELRDLPASLARETARAVRSALGDSNARDEPPDREHGVQ